MKKNSLAKMVSVLGLALFAQAANAQQAPRTLACGQVIKSANKGPETFNIDLGGVAGTSDMAFETFSIPDAIVVNCNGMQVYSSNGEKSGMNMFSVVVSAAADGASNVCTATVTPNENEGTEWALSASCPGYSPATPAPTTTSAPAPVVQAAPPAPTGPRALKCGQRISSLGKQNETFGILLGGVAGTSHLEFEAYSIPDSIVVTCGGVTVFSTHGEVSGAHPFTIKTQAAADGAENVCTATVKSNQNTGTTWDLFATCPGIDK